MVVAMMSADDTFLPDIALQFMGSASDNNSCRRAGIKPAQKPGNQQATAFKEIRVNQVTQIRKTGYDDNGKPYPVVSDRQHGRYGLIG